MWMKKKGNSYLLTRSEAAQLISSDLNEFGVAANNLAKHVFNLGLSGFGVSLLELIASIAAIYLLILDRTNWKTNILTSLLIPYIFFSLPSWLFTFFRLLTFLIMQGDFGEWIALIAVVLRLFLPRHFPEWLELPAALILLIVVAPGLFAHTFRNDVVGVAICLVIACYLLQEHIRASGGFRNSFTKAHGISNTVGIVVLLVYPIWTLVVYIV